VGTSVSQPSPNTPNWRLARALLGRPDASPPDQVAELWRAATVDRARAWEAELADPLLAEAARIALTHRRDPQKALEQFDQSVYESRTRNFALELGRRALARAALSGTGPEGFAAELFSEATSYYVARDLPGFVGSPNRVKNAQDALRLKAELQNVARVMASGREVPVDARGWAHYVTATIGLLIRRGVPR
jgi:hypothetical protein